MAVANIRACNLVTRSEGHLFGLRLDYDGTKLSGGASNTFGASSGVAARLGGGVRAEPARRRLMILVVGGQPGFDLDYEFKETAELPIDPFEVAGRRRHRSGDGSRPLAEFGVERCFRPLSSVSLTLLSVKIGAGVVSACAARTDAGQTPDPDLLAGRWRPGKRTGRGLELGAYTTYFGSKHFDQEREFVWPGCAPDPAHSAHQDRLSLELYEPGSVVALTEQA